MGVDLDASWQEDVPGQQGGALGITHTLHRSTNILSTVVGAGYVSQTESNRQLSHDAGGGDRTVDGIGDDRGTQSNHCGRRHLPVREVGAGLILQELDAVLGVEEAGHTNDVDGVELGHTPPNLFGGPTRVIDCTLESAIGDFTGLEECFELN